MWLIFLLFSVTGLWFYPLTLEIAYKGGWRVLWLPRLCGGYARPRPAPRLKREAWRAGRELEIMLPPRLSRLLARRLLAKLRLGRLSFLLAPGRVDLGCILSLRLGDIILSMLQAATVYLRRQRRSRR